MGEVCMCGSTAREACTLPAVPYCPPQALMYVCPNEALAMIVGLGSTFILDLFDGYVIA